ncbi:MAG: Xaa-Pro peptidase family protein [Thermodesulfobacteriota bacterium]|nr:Xaa-Pro peptidase family protein [Thermodesulfobacteriota bacterium]
MTENSFHKRRQRSVRKTINSNQLDGILFSGLENIRYLCGFTGSDGALLLTRKEAFFLTDSRYWTQAEDEVKHARIVHYKKKLDGIASLLSDLTLKKVGVEALSLTLSSYQFLIKILGGEVAFISMEDELKNLRAVKDLQELSLIRRAIDLSSKSFFHIVEMLKQGVVEREIAIEMEFFMKKSGAEATGFDIIIASGKRSALPHGRASNKNIKGGDFILIDFGLRFQGYHSDQTRTLICGNPTLKQKRIYQIVKEAHDRAVEAIRPGIPICEIDKAARDHIHQSGYGKYFGHGTGHGIGLAVHEDPVINGENKGLVEEGMVFTIEPGIYLPEWGGVRIEDMIRVTSQGAEVLTYLPAELMEI